MKGQDREVTVAVIGGGIVGLAVALKLTELPGVRPIVIEKESAVARHQTGHNSGVIHSGLYYAPGSLKAKLAVGGQKRLVDFLRDHGIPHDICGKVVVATSPAEIPRLETLLERGTANGIPGLRSLSTDELKAFEPHAAGLKALHVPTTGIVDFRAVAEKFAELIAKAGGHIYTRRTFFSAIRDGQEWVIETTSGLLRADFVINCGGLQCDRIARRSGSAPRVKIVPFRGEYYQLSEKAAGLVKNLIYPVPDPAFPFLGVHFTRMIHGGVEAGPNAVLALKREGYRKTDFSLRDTAETFLFPGFWRLAGRFWKTGMGEMWRSFSKAAFVRALQRLVPEIRGSDLEPHGAGVRAQAIDRDGGLLSDFEIIEEPGVIHVLNAPSPAATASLAIGEHIVSIFQARKRT